MVNRIWVLFRCVIVNRILTFASLHLFKHFTVHIEHGIRTAIANECELIARSGTCHLRPAKTRTCRSNNNTTLNTHTNCRWKARPLISWRLGTGWFGSRGTERMRRELGILLVVVSCCNRWHTNVRLVIGRRRGRRICNSFIQFYYGQYCQHNLSHTIHDNKSTAECRQATMGHFTFWISLSLRPRLRPNGSALVSVRCWV